MTPQLSQIKRTARGHFCVTTYNYGAPRMLKDCTTVMWQRRNTTVYRSSSCQVQSDAHILEGSLTSWDKGQCLSSGGFGENVTKSKTAAALSSSGSKNHFLLPKTHSFLQLEIMSLCSFCLLWAIVVLNWYKVVLDGILVHTENHCFLSFLNQNFITKYWCTCSVHNTGNA